MKNILTEDIGVMEYGAAWDLQESLMKKGLTTKLNQYSQSDSQEKQPIQNYLLLCCHPHVYTLGKSGDMSHLLIGGNQMKELGIQFYKTNRGGDITYHGPGQLVAYPILDLEQFFTDLGRYMHSLEESVILTLKEYGIESGRIAGSTGVWLDWDVPGKQRKICAMGVKSSRWITMHGLALNINTDLKYFRNIVPCGISDKGVASMHEELGKPVDEQEVQNIFLDKFASVFEAHIQPATESLKNRLEAV